MEQHARAREVRVLRLETKRALVEAIALSGSAGCRHVPACDDEPFAQHWFEKGLAQGRP